MCNVHIVLGCAAGFMATLSYQEFKHDNNEIGITFGIIALLCALFAGMLCGMRG